MHRGTLCRCHCASYSFLPSKHAVWSDYTDESVGLKVKGQSEWRWWLILYKEYEWVRQQSCALRQLNRSLLVFKNAIEHFSQLQRAYIAIKLQFLTLLTAHLAQGELLIDICHLCVTELWLASSHLISSNDPKIAEELFYNIMLKIICNPDMFRSDEYIKQSSFISFSPLAFSWLPVLKMIIYHFFSAVGVIIVFFRKMGSYSCCVCFYYLLYCFSFPAVFILFIT